MIIYNLMYRSILYGSFLTLLIVFATFYYILKKTLSKEIFGVLLLIDKRYLLFSLLCMFFYHTFDNLRLFILSRAMGIKYSFTYGYVISFINTFGATITPAHVGGEFMSLYTVSRKGGQFHKVMSVVTMKTITGLAFFVVFLPFTLYSLLNNLSQAMELVKLLVIVFLLAGISYGVFRFFLKRNSQKGLGVKIRNTLKRYLVSMKIFLRDKKLSLVLATLSSVLLYLSFLGVGVFLVKAFNSEVDALRIFLDQLFLVYALFISPTPGGSGVGELGALSVFAPFIDSMLLGVFSILWRFISQYLSALIGGILFLILLVIDAKRFKTHA